MILHRYKKGNTIVELVLYMGLLSIFLVAIFNVFAQILDTKNRSLAVSLVQRNGNYLITRLANDIKSSTSVTTPSAIGGTSPTMSLRIGSTTASYAVTNGRLQVNLGGGAVNLNDADTSISNFLVKNIGNAGGKTSLQIGFTLTSLVIDSTGLVKSESYQTTTSLR